MKKKINYYLVATALFVAIATMVSMTVINYYLFQKQVKEDLHVMAETIESTGILKQDINEIPQIDVEGIRVTWIDEDGTVLYDNQNDVKKLENHGDRPEVESAFDKGMGDSVRTSATMNSNTFYHAIKLNDGTVLRVSIAARSIWNMFASSIPAMLIVTVIIVGICVVLAKSLTRKLMKPIETLAGNLEQASVIQKKTEYKELVPFMNAIRIQHEGVLAAAKSRQDFTANVSHELKTPLTAISGYAELIENGMVEKEQQIHFATEIRRNAQRLLSLINDIIKLSELDSSEAQQGFEQLDLYGLVKDCMENLQVNAEQRKVALNFDGTDCMVRGNRQLLTELVENLCQNAIRYNNEGGTVNVTVHKLGAGGASRLSANSGTLNSGASQLASGTQQLVSGTGTLSSGSTQVKDGISKLAKGAKELSDGTKKFNDEGIKKIDEVVNEDLQDVLDRLDALRSDENAYTSFTGKSDNMDGNVKFVIETEAIDNK